MTKETRTALRALAEAAYRGPWEDIYPNVDDGDIRVQVVHENKRTFIQDSDAVAWRLTENNAKFIAASRTAIPELLTLVDELEAKVERYEKALNKLTAIECDGEYGGCECSCGRYADDIATEALKAYTGKDGADG